MIIRPDTSFFLSGMCSSACEKTTEKTFELPRPNSAMQIEITVLSCVKKSPARATIIISTLTRKNGRAAKRASRNAPAKLPIVRNRK